MKHLYKIALLSLIITACSADGVSKESSRIPAGNPDGVIRIMEFSDLQCPACRTLHGALSKPLLEQYGNAVRYEWKHFPLQSMHPLAMDSAQASECAADQGKFWEYIDLVFENQDKLSLDSLVSWAGMLNLDTDLFERCWKSKAKKGIVLDDYKEGRDLGVGGTPTFFMDGEAVQTNQLMQLIEERLEGFKQRL